MSDAEGDDTTPSWLDLDAVKKLKGLYTNRVYVQHLGEGLLRLNFGEVLDPDDPSYHTAIVVSAKNAAAFAELIYHSAHASMTATAAPASAEPDTADGDE